MRNLLLTIMLLILVPNALAVIDLLGPAENFATNSTSITFEYYASINQFQGCSLFIGEQSFPDLDAESNAMNDVKVQNIAQGVYTWNIECTGNNTEKSSDRTLTIDTILPTLVIVDPDEGSSASSLAIDIIPNDNRDSQLSCSIRWEGVQLDSVEITANTHYAQTYNVQPGTGTMEVSCTDDAGNNVKKTRTVTIEAELFLSLNTDKTTYGIDEPVLLTIDSLPNADVSIDVCPNTGGFVQCTSALLDMTTFPQTITLPYMNKTGSYLIDGLAQYGDDTVSAQQSYEIENTLTINVDHTGVAMNKTITLTAEVFGGVAPYHLEWTLTNNTIRKDTSTVDVVYYKSGAFNISITATDNAENKKTIIETIVVDPEHDVTFVIIDNKTGTPISNVLVEFAENEWSTLQDGLAYFRVPEGKHQLFISATGYQYVVDELRINTTRTVTQRLDQVSGNPSVVISYPGANSTVGSPVGITYTVQHTKPVTCTLLKATDTNWFIENGTMKVTDATAQKFVRKYDLGKHKVRIECADDEGRSGSSKLLSFTLSDAVETEVVAEVENTPPPATDGEVFLQKVLADLESIIAGFSTYGEDEHKVMELIEFDDRVRRLKRTVQQAIRDIDDIRFRKDLTDESRAIEREKIVQRVRDALKKTPIGLDVRDLKQHVRYVEEEDLDDVFSLLEPLGEYLDSKSLRNDLLEDQQKFTITSNFVHGQYQFYDGTLKEITIVIRAFTYAKDMGSQYRIFELIPKSAVKDAAEIELITDGEVLLADPILAFPAKSTVVYSISDEIPFHKLEEIHTLLVGEYESGNAITGLAILSSTNINILGWPVILSVILIVFGFIFYRTNMFEQLKFIFYKFGKHEQVHYVRVLINDAEDQLQAKDYDKAELLYREIRMTYDTLPDIEKNDLFDDVMGLVRTMDSYYFNMIMIELDGHVRAGDMQNAITSYEKLIGTFERLESDEQKQLVDTITALAKRLGVAA